MTSQTSSINNCFSPTQSDDSFCDSLLSVETDGKSLDISYGKVFEEIVGKKSFGNVVQQHKIENSKREGLGKSGVIHKFLFDGEMSNMMCSQMAEFEANTNIKRIDFAEDFNKRNSNQSLENVTVRRNSKPSEYVTVRKDRGNRNSKSPKPTLNSEEDNKISKSNKKGVEKQYQEINQPNLSSINQHEKEKAYNELQLNQTKNFISMTEINSNLHSIIENSNKPEISLLGKHSSEILEKDSDCHVISELNPNGCEHVENENSSVKDPEPQHSSVDLQNQITDKEKLDTSHAHPLQVQTNSIEKLIRDAVSSEFDVIRQIMYHQHLSLYKFLDNSMEKLRKENEENRKSLAEEFRLLTYNNQVLWSLLLETKMKPE